MILSNKEFFEFLERDYDKKTEQLHRHLLSIWTRFNFFISFEGLIIASKFLSKNITSTDSYSGGICFLGLFSGIIWYCFSANDRYLVKVYRCHIEDAFDRINAFLKENGSDIYNKYYIDDFNMSITSKNKVKSNILGWRYDKLGLTDYATMVPLLIVIFWFTYIIKYPLQILFSLLCSYF